MPTSVYLLQNSKPVRQFCNDPSVNEKEKETKRNASGFIRTQRFKVGLLLDRFSTKFDSLSHDELS